MVIDERAVGPVTILTPQGRLTVETFGELKSRVGRLVADGRLFVVLNLGAVAYVDSIGVAELVRAHVMLARRGGRLALSHLHRTVAELLRLARLTDLFEIFPTEEEAVQRCATAARSTSRDSGGGVQTPQSERQGRHPTGDTGAE